MPGRRPNGNPSRRARSDPYPGLINRPNRGAPIGPNHTVPYGTVPVFAPIPGNKLPGYFRNVPTGQRQLTPVHEFDSTSQDSRTSRNPISPARSFSRSGHWFSDRPYLPHHSSSSVSLVKDLCDLCDLAVNRFSVQLGPVR